MLDLNVCPAEDLFLRRRALRQELLAQPALQDIRIAVLSGSTTEPFVAVLELLLLHSGFRPTFHQGAYGRFYEEAIHDVEALKAFAPQLVYLHTSSFNLQSRPALTCTEEDLAVHVQNELARWQEIWDSLEAQLGCIVIQNNFELPPVTVIGNLAASAPGGSSRFVAEMNRAFNLEAGRRPKLLLQDVHGVAASLGLGRWYDLTRFFSYKVLFTQDAHLALARSLAAIVRAVYSRSRKVLVLDLDNTLWGGVIGDDGVQGIQIGRETPQAEAYTAFQEYCLALRSRGILLAVCSKNDEENARSGFEHPDSVLKLDHISSFKANWLPKHENLEAIAAELNLGLDSFVFVDDNPAEREIVRAQLPMVAVPEVGKDVSEYPRAVEAGRYFEPATLSSEDFARAGQYAANAERAGQAARFTDYGQYLDSLEMQAEIALFTPIYLDRIAQLTNKTNQFNLTTRRYTLAEITSLAADPTRIPLYGRLADRFGDNGLVSVVIGHLENDTVEIDLWLMSCRVLKREMELAMLDALAAQAIARGATRLVGHYLPSAKNSMVAQLYPSMGFTPIPSPHSAIEGTTAWELSLAGFTPRTTHIQLLEPMYA